MLWMISKFVLCLIGAGIFGFVFGWILASLIKNEKLEKKYNLLKEDFEEQKANINELHSELSKKDEELKLLEKKYQQSQKELMMKNMDIEEYEKKGLSLKSDNDYILEINSLKEEIAEYRYLENENSLLHNEIRELEDEKEKLLKMLEEYKKEFDNNEVLDNKRIYKKFKKLKKELNSILKELDSNI